MYNSFEDLYNKTFINFYNSCKYKELISKKPIPYEIDKNLKSAGRYSEGTVLIKDYSIDTDMQIRNRCSELYHEFTHYYDESVFKNRGYSEEDIQALMLTFSEIHAAYNGMFAFFGISNLSVKKRINISNYVFDNKKISEWLALKITNEIHSMNNILGFKFAMYLLGEKRAMLQISSDILSINKAYNYKIIPDSIRNEIICIDKLININSYENINVREININKLKAENELMRISIKRTPLPQTEPFEQVRKNIDEL